MVLLGLLFDAALRLLFGPGTPTIGPWAAALHTPPLPTMLIVAMGTAVGPLADELFFRASLFRRWADAGRPWSGAVFSSLLFALSRLDGWNFIAYVAVGLALAGLYRRTRTLAAPVSAHAALNVLMFVFLFSG
jgi:membrane protease YdiL (CAAX protease family)